MVQSDSGNSINNIKTLLPNPGPVPTLEML